MKLICNCGKEVKLEELPGNYNHNYEGQCSCGTYWGIENCTETMEEMNAADAAARREQL